MVTNRAFSGLRLLHVLLEPFRTAVRVEEVLAHRDLNYFGVVNEWVHAEHALGKVEFVALSEFFVVSQMS